MATLAQFPSATAFTTRVPSQFICPDNTALNVSLASPLFNNYAAFVLSVGNVEKIELGLNGIPYYRGDIEFPPFNLELDWSQLGNLDYLRLAKLRKYFIHFGTHQGLGYYGKLVMKSYTPVAKKIGDVGAVKALFYPLAPSDTPTGTPTLARLSTPSVPTVTNNSIGFIPTSQTIFYWMTFSSIWGETLPSTSVSATGHVGYNLSWVWPTSTSFVYKASLYCSHTNNPNPTDPTAVKLLADVYNGQTPSWIDYVGPDGIIVKQQPPIVSNAFRGEWNGGIWINES